MEIDGFLAKQKMRLRTFDGDGDTPEGASPPISKIDVGAHGQPARPNAENYSKNWRKVPDTNFLSSAPPLSVHVAAQQKTAANERGGFAMPIKETDYALIWPAFASIFASTD